jgi:hypothetical protein
MTDYANTSWRRSAQGDRLENIDKLSGHSRGRLCSTLQETAGGGDLGLCDTILAKPQSLDQKTWLEK